MITTPVSNIQSSIDSSPSLSTGMRFLRLLREEGLVERSKGYYPMILGGAVRNSLFLPSPVNDVDIFIFSRSRAEGVVNHPRSRTVALGSLNSVFSSDLADIRQNIVSWLEDQEIEFTSLLSVNVEMYDPEGNRFSEILEFYWEGIKFQIMIPVGGRVSSCCEDLINTMPVFARVGLTLDYLIVSEIAIADFKLPAGRRFVQSEVDVRYLGIKQPDALLIPVGGSAAAIHHSLGLAYSVPLSESTTLGANSARDLARSAFLDTVPVANRSLVLAGISSNVPDIS